MHRARNPLPAFPLLALLLLGACPPGAPGQPEDPRALPAAVGFETLSGPGLSIRAHWFGTMHMTLRGAGGSPPDLEGFAPVARAVEEAAGTARIWALLDPEIVTRDRFELPAWLDGLPLERVVEPGRVEATREAIDGYLDVMLPMAASTYDSWEGAVLPELTERGRVLSAELTGEDGLLRPTLEALGIDIGRGEAVVELVPRAPRPGAMTYRTASGPVSVVAVRGIDDATLLEIVLHEAVHAFDAMPPVDGRPDALRALREALDGAGLDGADARYRDTWHALFFVHAAEMVRRDGRPGYVDYGDRAGVYARSGPGAAVVRERWPAVLEGSLTLGEFVALVAEAAAGSAEGPAAGG